MTIIGDDEMADYRDAIEKKGLDEADFEIEEGLSEGPVDNSVGSLISTVKITCKPSGESQRYNNIGNGSSWPYLFGTYLNRGIFIVWLLVRFSCFIGLHCRNHPDCIEIVGEQNY